METVKKPWYKTGWGVILTILFFPILGTYLIWAKSGWKTWVKIISTLGIISIVVASNSQENEPTSTAATKTSTSSKKDYKYEVLANYNCRFEASMEEIRLHNLYNVDITSIEIDPSMIYISKNIM